MGTNYYLKNGKHIGKRSAAGAYCWDCHITLCKDGEAKIHEGCHKKGHIACNCGWFKSCPKCGKEFVKEDLDNSSAGRELGFNKSRPRIKTGVATCSSFTWAMPPLELIKYCCSKTKAKKPIRNEYDYYFTFNEFVDILSECPVIYYDSIGQEFS